MISRITPAARLVHAIQAPARGSAVTEPENSPTPTSSAVIPSENTNRYTNPRNPLRVVATQVSTAANAGAPQGAATIPDVAPSRKTAGYEPPPRLPTQVDSRAGSRTGMTSSIARAKTSSRLPMMSRAQKLAPIVPNNDPDIPAIMPSSA